MVASLRIFPVASLVLLVAACGSKGTGAPDDTDTGSGGTGGSGSGGTGSGTGGGAGAPVEPMLVYGFESGDENWDVTYVSSADDVDDVSETDIEVEWSQDAGMPAGALRVQIPYESHGQYVGIGIEVADAETDGLDLSGKRRIEADVMIESGVGDPDDLATNPAGAKLYAKSGSSYVYANGSFTNVEAIGQWVRVRFEVDDPSFTDLENGVFDPGDIREFGVQLDTSGTSMSAQTGVWILDNISY